MGCVTGALMIICLSITTVHELLILEGMTGRPDIAKAKWLGLRPGKTVGDVVLDRITRKDIRVIGMLKTVALRMEEWRRKEGFNEWQKLKKKK